MFLSQPPDSAAAEALYRDDRDADGYVNNLTRLWCWRPEVLADFYRLRGLLADSGLSTLDVAVLFASTAAARGDAYCSLAWGGQLAAEAGDAIAARVLRGELDGLDERVAVLASWARMVATDPNSATARDIDRLRVVGLSERQIIDATFLVAWRLAFTSVNDALGARPDAQLAASASESVRAAVSFGRPPGDSPSTP